MAAEPQEAPPPPLIAPDVDWAAVERYCQWVRDVDAGGNQSFWRTRVTLLLARRGLPRKGTIVHLEPGRGPRGSVTGVGTRLAWEAVFSAWDVQQWARRKQRETTMGPLRVLKCRWCNTPVQPPRRTFCSDWCVEVFLLHNNQGRRRWWVEQRDRGVCALCGLDTEALRAAIVSILDWARNASMHVDFNRRRPLEVWARIILRNHGFAERLDPHFLTVQHLWEADHIQPQAEGGSHWLSNLRTLCLPCHRGETKLLAQRLGLKRRAQGRLALQPNQGTMGRVAGKRVQSAPPCATNPKEESDGET